MMVYGCRTSSFAIQEARGYLMSVNANQRSVVRAYLCYNASLHIWIQLLEHPTCVVCSEAIQAIVVQKEVDAKVGLSHQSRVLDGEMAYTGQYKVFECFYTSHAGPGVDEKDVGFFQRRLATGCPQA